MRTTIVGALLLVALGALAPGDAMSQGGANAKSEANAKRDAGAMGGAKAKGGAQVSYPEGYRRWAHVKSMVIEEGHPLYEAFGGIHHIYANETARKALAAGKGRYPDGAVFVFDLLEAVDEDDAITEGQRKVVGVMQRDAKRFADTGGWGFEGFKGDTRERAVTDMHACFDCHAPEKERGYVFSELRK